MRRYAVVTAAAVVAAVGLCATRAMAQGFSVYEHDACTMGRSGAGVASPCNNGSAIFFNPAGIVTGEAGRWNLAFGATMIPPRGSFVPDHPDTTPGNRVTDLVKNNIPVPNVYLTRQIGSRFAVGFGVFAPYGLTTEWPSTFAGRFVSYKATLQSIYMQPTVAFRVSPRFQIGAGLDIIRTSVELHQRVDLSTQLLPGTTTPFSAIGIPAGTDFADARIHGNATSYAAHFGVTYRVNDRIAVGARYLTGVTVKGSGYAGFTQVATGILLPAGNPFGVPAGYKLDNILATKFNQVPTYPAPTLVTQTVSASIALPAQFVAGVDVKLREGLHLFGDVEWTQWSKFANLPLSFALLPSDTLYEGYKNTIGWRAALEYAVSPKFTVRGGFLTHPAAAPSWNVTPLLPEAGRFEGIIGAGYQIGRGVRLDGALQLIKQSDRRGRIIDYKPGDPDPNSGKFKFSALLFGLGLSFAF
jgi:long-chain fatty acid transport protein